jgi:hypothetical protein
MLHARIRRIPDCRGAMERHSTKRNQCGLRQGLLFSSDLTLDFHSVLLEVYGEPMVVTIRLP